VKAAASPKAAAKRGRGHGGGWSSPGKEEELKNQAIHTVDGRNLAPPRMVKTL